MLAADTKAVAEVVPAQARPSSSPAWKEIVSPVEPFLDSVSDRLARQVDAFHADLAACARYALTNNGKQLRPALVALSGAATGPLTDHHVTVAVIIEMIHLATLVHDDVMDEARIRRQRPTLAANWGNELSVLLGDCLFARALELAAGFPTTEVCRSVSAATNTVCAGEILQAQRRGRLDLRREDYFEILAMKTGELFALSCELGVWLNGGAGAARAAMRRYGLALGTAYQIYDDCVDVFGSERVVGKSLGTDLAKGKLTLPVLVALERATGADRRRLEDLLAPPGQPEALPRVVEVLDQCDALGESLRAIHRYLDAARQALGAMGASASGGALGDLTEFLAQQTGALGDRTCEPHSP